MKKWLKRILTIALLAVFLGSGYMVVKTLHQYRASQRLYNTAAEEFVRPAPSAAPQQAQPSQGAETPRPSAALQESDAPSAAAPIVVDFDALKAAGKDVVGWLYCEGTVINYPVVQTSNNDYYLHRSYDGNYNFPGSIFVEAANSPGFQDYNTIIYGHNMRDGTMFAELEDWSEPGFYAAHPVMWLLTPEQDYRISIFSGYTTVADSQAYTMFSGPGAELSAYVQEALTNSDFQTSVQIPADARFVLLSTCAYTFDNARYVLHGVLEPVNSAGGVLKQ